VHPEGGALGVQSALADHKAGPLDPLALRIGLGGVFLGPPNRTNAFEPALPTVPITEPPVSREMAGFPGAHHANDP